MRFDEWQDSNGVPVLDGTDLSIPSSALPAGTILQVVSTIKTDTFTTTSATFGDVTGLSVTITPTSTTSKILVSCFVGLYSHGTDEEAIHFQLAGGNTAAFIGDSAGSRVRAVLSSSNTVTGSFQNRIGNSSNIQYLDSPSTTSAITYKLQARVSSGTGHVNRSATDSDNASYPRVPSSITVMEVAG
jgi:hypothetical protein